MSGMLAADETEIEERERASDESVGKEDCVRWVWVEGVPWGLHDSGSCSGS